MIGGRRGRRLVGDRERHGRGHGARGGLPRRARPRRCARSAIGGRPARSRWPTSTWPRPITLRLIGRLGPQFARRGRKRGTVVAGRAGRRDPQPAGRPVRRPAAGPRLPGARPRRRRAPRFAGRRSWPAPTTCWPSCLVRHHLGQRGRRSPRPSPPCGRVTDAAVLAGRTGRRRPGRRPGRSAPTTVGSPRREALDLLDAPPPPRIAPSLIRPATGRPAIAPTIRGDRPPSPVVDRSVVAVSSHLVLNYGRIATASAVRTESPGDVAG